MSAEIRFISIKTRLSAVIGERTINLDLINILELFRDFLAEDSNNSDILGEYGLCESLCCILETVTSLYATSDEALRFKASILCFEIFARLCRPGDLVDCTSQKNCKRMSENGIIANFKELFHLSYSDSTKLEMEKALLLWHWSCRAVAVISSSSGVVRREIYQSEPIRLAIHGILTLQAQIVTDYQMLTAAVAASDSYHSSLSCVANLTMDSEARPLFGDIGVCPIVLEIASKHVNDNTTYKAAIPRCASLAVGNLCNCNFANTFRFLEIGTCEFLIQVLQQFMNDREVTKWCIYAISKMSSNDPTCRDVFGDINVCGLLKDSLEVYMNDSGVYQYIFNAVSYLSFDNGDNRSRFGSEPFCRLIIDCITSHFDNLELIQEACVAIGNICLDNEEAANRLCQEFFICRLMSDIHRNYGDDELIVGYCLFSITALACTQQTRESFATLGIYHACIDVMNRHRQCSIVCSRCCDALCKLGCNNPNIQREMMSNGLLEIITMALANYSNDASVLSSVCWLISQLAENGVGREEFENMKLFDQLHSLIPLQTEESVHDALESAMLAVTSSGPLLLEANP